MLFLFSIISNHRKPVDPEISTLGGIKLSLLDIAKLNSAYKCTLDPPICGDDGYKYLGTGATSGIIDGRQTEGPCPDAVLRL